MQQKLYNCIILQNPAATGLPFKAVKFTITVVPLTFLTLFYHQLAALAPSSPNKGTNPVFPAQTTAVPPQERLMFAPVKTVITAQTQILQSHPAQVSEDLF